MNAEPQQLIFNKDDLNDNKTGYLPVNIKINNPNFIQKWAIENENGEFQFENYPIIYNGKYKFEYHSGEMGPFAIGYFPVLRNDQNNNDWDLNININNEIYIIDYFEMSSVDQSIPSKKIYLTSFIKSTGNYINIPKFNFLLSIIENDNDYSFYIRFNDSNGEKSLPLSSSSYYYVVPSLAPNKSSKFSFYDKNDIFIFTFLEGNNASNISNELAYNIVSFSKNIIKFNLDIN